MRRTNWLVRFPWLLAALVAYYLPWISNPAAAFSQNAYDLAEWTSLSPGVRGASIPYLAPFLLRVVLGGLAWLFGVQALKGRSGRTRWLYNGLALVLAVTLLPPPDFFRGFWDDANYRQQFAVSIGTLAGLVAFAAAGTRGLPSVWLFRLEILIAVLAISSAIAGEILALAVVRSIGVEVSMGIGAVALVVCLVLVCLFEGLRRNNAQVS